MNKHIATVVLAVLMAVAGVAHAQTKTVVKYAISDPDGTTPAAQALKIFKNYVEFRSNGSIEVQTFFGTMGDARQTTEQVKLGVLQMTNAEDGAFAGFYPRIQAINLPYLFPSAATAWDFLRGDFARRMADDIRQKTGLAVLAFTENGFRNITNNVHQVDKPDDMKGLKMRVMQSPVFIEMMKSMGAGATPIPINELILALKQNIVDGEENEPVFMNDWGIGDVQKYLTMTEHVFSAQLYLINAKFLASLTADQQAVLAAGAQLASMQNIVVREGQSSRAIEAMKQKGLQVHMLTAAEKDLFRKTTQPPVLAYLKSQLGDEFMDNLLKAVAESEAHTGVAPTN
jgi:tripartite ATP-independent transporter DctP family solute receptor